MSRRHLPVPPDLPPAIRQLDHGGRLALVGFVVILLGLVLWSRGAPSWVLPMCLAVGSTASVFAAVRVIGAFVRIRRITKREKAKQRGAGGSGGDE